MVLKSLETMIQVIHFLDVPLIEIDQRLCSNHYMVGSCERCSVHCPVDALKIDGKVTIDPEKCVRCGACSTVCLNGVFRMLDIPDGSVFSMIDRISSSSDSIIIKCNGCNNAYSIKNKKVPKGTGIIVLPCFGRVNEAMLLRCHEIGFHRLMFSDCDGECPFGRAGSVLDETLALTTRLLDGQRTIGVKQNKKIPSDTRSLIIENQDVKGRREFIYEVGKGAASIVLGIGVSEGDDAGKRTTSSNLRRQALVSFLIKNYAKEMTILRAGLPFAEIEIAPSCNMCGACCRLCPTGALLLKEDDHETRIAFDTVKCMGCELCRKVCKVDSLKIKEEFKPSSLGNDPVTLHSMLLGTCTACNEGFVPVTGSGLCPGCIKEKELKTSFMNNISG